MAKFSKQLYLKKDGVNQLDIFQVDWDSRKINSVKNLRTSQISRFMNKLYI